MKARFAEHEDGLQIVINFETDEERLLARHFLRSADEKNKEFCLHGFGGGLDKPGWGHMNFGFRCKNE